MERSRRRQIFPKGLLKQALVLSLLMMQSRAAQTALHDHTVRGEKKSSRYEQIHSSRKSGSAKEVIRTALDRMGGEATLREIKSLKLVWQGYKNLVEQSTRPEGPWVPVIERTTELWDLQGRRFSSTTDSYVGNSFTSQIVVTNGIGAQAFGGNWAFVNQGIVSDADEQMDLSPFRVLLNALDSQDLRITRQVIMQGTPHRVLSFTWRGMAIRLFLNVFTGLPTAVEKRNAYPYDMFWSVFGDITTLTYFSYWAPAAGDIQFPRQWDIERNGMHLKTIVIADVALNVQLSDNVFELPENVRARFEKTGQLTLDESSDSLSSRTSGILAKGVVQIPGNFNVALVEQNDGVVIIEAPVSSGYSVQVIAEARRRFPEAPIKAVISTSAAWPHFGGLREYIARGYPVFVLDLNVPIIQWLVRSPHRLHPDDLERKPKKADLRLVAGKTVLGAGANRLEIYPIRTQTGERQMMVYFPEHRLLYGSDLAQPAGKGLFQPQNSNELAQAVKREGLRVETVFAMHSEAVPWTRILESFAAQMGETRK